MLHAERVCDSFGHLHGPLAVMERSSNAALRVSLHTCSPVRVVTISTPHVLAWISLWLV